MNPIRRGVVYTLASPALLWLAILGRAFNMFIDTEISE